MNKNLIKSLRDWNSHEIHSLEEFIMSRNRIKKLTPDQIKQNHKIRRVLEDMGYNLDREANHHHIECSKLSPLREIFFWIHLMDTVDVNPMLIHCLRDSIRVFIEDITYPTDEIEEEDAIKELEEQIKEIDEHKDTMVKHMELFNNYKGGNTRLVVTSEKKFKSLIDAGVTDSRLTYVRNLRAIVKPIIRLGGNYTNTLAIKQWSLIFKIRNK